MSSKPEQLESSLTQANMPRPGWPALLLRLRERLLPGGVGVMALAGYAMILAALITFIVQSPDRTTWRFYGTLLALSAMLALYVAEPDIETRFEKSRVAWFLLIVNGGLFLLANWMSLPIISFIPFLLYMFSSQAVIELPFRTAILYSLNLAGGWLLILLTKNFALAEIVNSAIGISLGLIFTTTFSLVLLLFGKQKAHAEMLLQQLRVANAELEAAREREKELAVTEERLRLAREIHDGLGHHLTVLNVQLQAAAKLVGRDPERATQTISICREEAQAALEEVRQSVAAMRHSPLDGRSLDEALRTLVGDFDRHAALAARFELRGSPVALGPAAAITLYRAAQEGLTNAQKHAAAQQVVVTLDFDPTRVRLLVQDDGGGSSITSSGGSFGLAGLHERAEQLGGKLCAATHVGGGFLLELELPINRNT